jgi:hypothetical protein
VTCCTLTGDRNHDCFAHGAEGKASCAALFSAALAHGETPHYLAEQALRQIHAELTILSTAIADGEAAAYNPDILSCVITGIAERARVAAEVSGRIRAAPVEDQLQAAGEGANHTGASEVDDGGGAS